MLIITADDLGKDVLSTNNCMDCHRKKRITTASILVFMDDTERAAELAVQEGLETGLHLNLVLPYSSPDVSDDLRCIQHSAVRFYRLGPWTQAVYNPLITKAVASVFKSQLDEYRRIFKKEPIYFNGHKHLHLSLNMILGRVLPFGSIVRKSFTFQAGEKNLLNRRFRSIVDAWLKSRYVISDSFYSLSLVRDPARLAKIVNLALNSHVELMVHPWSPADYDSLLGKDFGNLLLRAPLGNFEALGSLRRSQSRPGLV